MAIDLAARPAQRQLAESSSLLSDDALPAVRFLTGDSAADVVGAPIEAAGGRLVSVRVRDVKYRPGSELVVKYAAEIGWPGRAAKRETIMAATSAAGAFEGTVPVSALIDGQRVDVGVWRWPFDPVLVGLADAVANHTVVRLCGLPDSSSIQVKVLAFRPTERAVVRVTTATDTFFVKVVPPAAVPTLVEVHRAADAAGVPVPRVRASFADLGIVVFEELGGSLLKEHVKSGSGTLPAPAEFDALADRIAAIDADLPAAPSRVGYAVGHAAMLRSLDGAPHDQLDRLVNEFSRFLPDVALQPIHGDLHEGQVITEHGRVTGVLDLDDLGLGSPLEERANLIGFLRFRAITLPSQHERITRHADELRAASANRHDLDRLDVATAAVLVGLATGPFRIQQAGWQDTVTSVIQHAVKHLPTHHPHGSRATPPTPMEES